LAQSPSSNPPSIAKAILYQHQQEFPGSLRLIDRPLAPKGYDMPSKVQPKPLHQFPLTNTGSVDELEQMVRKFYGDIRFSLPNENKNFTGLTNHRQLKSIGLTYAAHQANLNIQLPAFQFYGQLLAYRGAARVKTSRRFFDVDRKNVFVGSPDQFLDLEYPADFEQLVLKIDPAALEKKFETLTGKAVVQRLQFESHTDVKSATYQHLHQMFFFLLSRLDSTDEFHPWAVEEFEQTLITTFICTHRHNLSHLLDRTPTDVAPWQVRKAEEYIEANWDQPLTVEALSIVTGASARSIFHFFKKSRGYSPMDFVRHKRLEHARTLLMDPHSRESVTEVAFACGFGNLGHFANYYHRKYGELPSHTAKRTKHASFHPK
jgi:AraC-like DNA-binding protein